MTNNFLCSFSIKRSFVLSHWASHPSSVAARLSRHKKRFLRLWCTYLPTANMLTMSDRNMQCQRRSDRQGHHRSLPHGYGLVVDLMETLKTSDREVWAVTWHWPTQRLYLHHHHHLLHLSVLRVIPQTPTFPTLGSILNPTLMYRCHHRCPRHHHLLRRYFLVLEHCCCPLFQGAVSLIQVHVVWTQMQLICRPVQVPVCLCVRQDLHLSCRPSLYLCHQHYTSRKPVQTSLLLVLASTWQALKLPDCG